MYVRACGVQEPEMDAGFKLMCVAGSVATAESTLNTIVPLTSAVCIPEQESEEASWLPASRQRDRRRLLSVHCDWSPMGTPYDSYMADLSVTY